MPTGDSVEEAELESELNELIKEVAEEDQEVKAKLSAESRVRIGKRQFDLSDLPEVPSGTLAGPSTSKAAATENGDTSLEERWKRLKTHAT
jgi:hypothetical protein